ncbi:hypothetical protein [Halorarum salinum]|uniref:Type IV pilin n=1 Tax=Halorarum salinum TaxID=2743089 RepID=A0A7D5QD35_9EURY|nr:hypothetical protein [Halobaculum salinum]QLG63539.1 hypothetical protein HUG12_18120 [Halobaculum salinum]
MEEEWDLEKGEDDESKVSLRGRARANLPALALGLMLASAVSVAAIGGAVATGVGESSYVAPDGFSFTVDRNGDTPAVVIIHDDGTVPNADRVLVVDEAGNEVTWEAVRTGPGTAAVTGDSALACPRQGATYTVVFDDRRATETVSTYEVDAPIPASVVERCEAAG